MALTVGDGGALTRVTACTLVEYSGERDERAARACGGQGGFHILRVPPRCVLRAVSLLRVRTHVVGASGAAGR